MSLSRPQTLELQNALQQAIIACSQRCLYQSARWAAELLDSLSIDDEHDASLCNLGHFANSALQRDSSELLLEQIETPKYLMAKAFFDCHEFLRCAETLLPASPSGFSTVFYKSQPSRLPRKGLSQRGLFLACYALLIYGEKQKAEDAAQILGPSDTSVASNKQLPKIRSILEKWFTREKDHSDHGSSQGWLEYLSVLHSLYGTWCIYSLPKIFRYGMVLAKDQNYDLAKLWLLKSVSINPWNWGTWEELCSLVHDAKDLDSIYSQLQPSIMAFIFSICCRQELHHISNSLLSDISQLQTLFPRSPYLQGQRALVYYRMKELESARSIFSDMLISHAGCLEFLDHYSNVLYTLGSGDRLSFVAQLASSVEPYRPETCCVIGNYYSLISRHVDAAICFRRALALNRSFASAWTLLGHEYLKLENSHAALSSYSRAISLNKQDYRAYFGLGQSYELLERPKMALDFYRRALLLRPGEMDIWQAITGCLVNLSKLPQAINSIERALACTGSTTRSSEEYTGDISLRCKRVDMLFQLATLHEELHNRQDAIISLEKCLEEATEYISGSDSEKNACDQFKSIVSKAQLLLTRWALESGDHMIARHFANRIDQYREEAQR
ncbi:anaphase promoting complex subunit 8 [Xylaria sp. FL1777]|nr:anaphase promoting complex subunit 8 [Xylaria sp. FL1777]